MRYIHYIEDSSGDLIDLEIYCSAQCWRDAGLGDPYGHYTPCPEATDYDQHCPQCGVVAVAAIDAPSFDGWPMDPHAETSINAVTSMRADGTTYHHHPRDPEPPAKTEAEYRGELHAALTYPDRVCEDCGKDLNPAAWILSPGICGACVRKKHRKAAG